MDIAGKPKQPTGQANIPSGLSAWLGVSLSASDLASALQSGWRAA